MIIPTGWLKRSGASIKADKSPTCDIACPHGGLLTSKQARRLSVPYFVFTFLKRLWLQDRKRDVITGKAKPIPTATSIPQPPVTIHDGGSAGNAKELETIDTIIVDGEKDTCHQAVPNSDSISIELEKALSTTGVSQATNDVPASVKTSNGHSNGNAATSDSSHRPACSGDNGLTSENGRAHELQAVREFPVASSWECDLCVEGLGQALGKQAQLRLDIEKQRQELSLLAANTPAPLVIGQSYYLIPG